nr:hypothetical protein GCM10020092_106640 [Actinoplanes digitatis]
MAEHPHHHHGGVWHRVRHVITPHSHDSADKVDSALEASRDGMRALWISLAVLGVTAALQALIVASSGSVALLGDTLHNVADALTAVPLGIAFWLGRRAATRAYTYGFGRAEDLAGIVIVLVIAGSAIAAGWFAVGQLLEPRPMTHLPWVLAAGLIGFCGNELVARYRITVGRRIGSAALVADGLHARTDGYTSLAVVLAAARHLARLELGRPGRRPRHHRRHRVRAQGRRPRGLPLAHGPRRPADRRRGRGGPARDTRRSRRRRATAALDRPPPARRSNRRRRRPAQPARRARDRRRRRTPTHPPGPPA